MPNYQSTSYRWVDDPEVTDFSVAGCVTVVTASSEQAVLTAVGADAQPSDVADISSVDGMNWVSIAQPDAGLADGAIVLIEDGGWEGARPEVLKRLSKKGAAASVFWNVNGMVMFSCARRGRVQLSLEMPDTDEEAAVLPVTLRRIWLREHTVAGPVAVAMAMLEKVTGVVVPPDDAIAHPQWVHPVTKPVLSLPVTPDGLLGLEYPSPAVVAAARTADGARCRMVAEWAVTEALAAAGITELPQLASTLQQFGVGAPVVLSAEASSYRQAADRAISASELAMNVDGDRARSRQLRSRAPGHWAMEALAYLAVPDDLIAVLGATYCAGVPRTLGSKTHKRYLHDVVNRLSADT